MSVKDYARVAGGRPSPSRNTFRAAREIVPGARLSPRARRPTIAHGSQRRGTGRLAMSTGADSTRAVFFALGANAAIAAAKYVAAWITGSGSMLAEAVHSTADTGNQLLLLLGL